VWSASVKGGRQILMQRVSNYGQRMGGNVKISATSGISQNPEIVWNGKIFAVAWTNAAPKPENPKEKYRLFLSVIKPKATKPLLTKMLTFRGSADRVSISAAKDEFGIAWVGSKESAGSAIYFTRLDLKGNQLGEILKVTDDKPIAAGRPDLAFSGDGYGVTWHDSRFVTGSEIFFTFISCADKNSVPDFDSAAESGDTSCDSDCKDTDSKSNLSESELKEVF
jgi:hypothetical protein